jgi:putative glutamine amidotransferase
LTARIAVTQRVIENQSYPETRDSLARNWPDWIATVAPAAAILPVPNRPESVDDWWAAAAPEILVLSGGNDWGEAPERDETERRLLQSAESAGVPILAVCRGLQVLNMCYGGTILTDLSSVAPEDHVNKDHPIKLKHSAATSLAGGPEVTVNSYHNQGVRMDGLADGFKVFALADGEIVEGMFHETKPILAIQWHPERASPSAAFDRALALAIFSGGPFWPAAA